MQGSNDTTHRLSRRTAATTGDALSLGSIKAGMVRVWVAGETV